MRKRWPTDWPRDDAATPYQIIEQLRTREEGRPPPVGPGTRSPRLGQSPCPRAFPSCAKPTLTGSTDTCWNPVQRLHSGCTVWGDYVRPPGWIVRVFDPDANAGQSCQWSFAGAVVANTGSTKVCRSRRTMRFRRGQQRSPPIAARSASSFPQFPARLGCHRSGDRHANLAERTPRRA